MQAEITVRPATLADAEAIAIVHTTSWRETYAALVDPDLHDRAFDPERRRSMWTARLGAGSSNAVVAELEGRIIGFADADPADDDDPTAELTMLYVLAEAHGSGAGQALFDAAIGTAPAHLWVAEHNPRAQAFYRRNGFRPTGESTEFPPVGTTIRLAR